MYRTRRNTRGSATSLASENRGNINIDTALVTPSVKLHSSLPSSGPAAPALVASTRRGAARAVATKNSNDSNAIPAATIKRTTPPESSVTLLVSEGATEQTTARGQSMEVNNVVIANSTSQQTHQQQGNIGSRSNRTRRGSLSTTTQQLRRSERGAGAATTISQVMAASQARQQKDNVNINHFEHNISGSNVSTGAADMMTACDGDKNVATTDVLNSTNTNNSISNDENTQQRQEGIEKTTTVAANTTEVGNVGLTRNCCIGFVEHDAYSSANLLVSTDNIGSVSVRNKTAVTKTTTSTSIAILEIEKSILKGDIFRAKENSQEKISELISLPPILLVDGSAGLPLARSVDNASGDSKDTCGASDSSSVGSYEGESPKQSTFYVTVTDEGSVYFNPTTPDTPVIEEGETFSVNLPTHKIKSPTNPLPGLVSATTTGRSRKTKPQAVTYGGETHVGFLDSAGQAVINNGNKVTMEIGQEISSQFGEHSVAKNPHVPPSGIVTMSTMPNSPQQLIRATDVSSSSAVVSLEVPATSIDVSEFESHLDPQSIAVLENVLQSDQGREILTEALGEMGVVPDTASPGKQLWNHRYSKLGKDEAVVSSSTTGIVCVGGSFSEPTGSTITSCEVSPLTQGCHGHGKHPVISISAAGNSCGEKANVPVPRKISESESSSIRRSQRQQDRIERQEAERILAENQQMLQREKEIMSKATSCHSTIAVTAIQPPINIGLVSSTQMVVTSPVPAAAPVSEVPGAIAVDERMEDSGGRRPIRNRKLPAHLADPNYLSLEDATTAVKEATRRLSTQDMIPQAEEVILRQEEMKEEHLDEPICMNDEYTDDDPNRLWCICKQPHNNRFMICCDRCEDWFHGKCVNVTKSQGKAMELKNIPWHCPDCKKSILTDKHVISQAPTVLPQKHGTKQQHSVMPEKSLGRGRKSEDQFSPKPVSAKTAKAAAIAAALKAESEAAAVTALSAEPPSKIAAAATSKRGRRKSDKNEADESVATNCVICKNPSRSGSVYCSDQCVQQYAQAVGSNNSNSPSSDKSHSPTAPSMAISSMEHTAVTPATSTSTKSSMIATTPSKLKRSHTKSESAQDPIFNFHVINPGASVSTEVVPQKPKEITASALFKAQKEKNLIVSATTSVVTSPTSQDVSSQPISLTPFPVVVPEIIPNSVNDVLNSSSTDVMMKADTSDDATNKGTVMKMNTPAVVAKNCIEKEAFLVSCILDANEKPERHLTSLLLSSGVKISKPPSGKSSSTMRRSRTDSTCKSKERERRDSQRETKPDGPPSEKLHRENMRKSLKEILKNRIDGMSIGHKKKMEAIGNSADTVSIKIEDELVTCYGGANSTKCKNKYRSIYFNLKDEKNSLFREILLGNIKPYDLVRMTPEQMAPSELAQWRQQEKEKELDAIKRAELDKLAEAKKQELLDKGVEDAVQVAEESKPLDISDVIDEDADGKRLSSGEKDPSARDSKDRSSSHHRHHEKKELRTSEGKNRARDLKSDYDDRNRGKDKHRHEKERDREKDRKPYRHSSKSRHKSSSSSEKKSHHSKDREFRGKEKDSSRTKDKERSSDRHKYREKDQKPSSKMVHSSSSSINTEGSYKRHSASLKEVCKEKANRHQYGKSQTQKMTDSGSEDSKNEESRTLDQGFTLVVPESSSDCSNITQQSMSESRTSVITTAFEVSAAVSTTNTTSTSQAEAGYNSPVTVTESKTIVIESEQELPSSTIKTPDFTDDSCNGVKREEAEHVFQSTLVMPELGEFKASFYNVSHSEILKGLCFPESPVPIVGRIGPQTVWDYIDKMKKTKEIITFRLTPSSPADAKGYMSFFTYLSSRERLGVIGGISHPLKDVYLIPLGKHQPVPRCLLPFRGPGLHKERTHCLLAVVTRHTPNDGSLKRKLSTTEPGAKKKSKSEPTKVNRNKGNKTATIVTNNTLKVPSPEKTEVVTDKGDENEPYTPWDEDEKADVIVDSAAASITTTTTPESGSIVLSETQKQLQEIEAQIAKQKEDIVSILAGAKNVVGIPGLDGDYPESVSTENADATRETEEIPVFLRSAPALSSLDPRSTRSNIFKYQRPSVKFSANVAPTITIPGLDLETKDLPDDDVVVLDQNKDSINTPILNPVVQTNDAKKVRDSIEEAYSPSAMDFSDDEVVGDVGSKRVLQVSTYDDTKSSKSSERFIAVSSDCLELETKEAHSDFELNHLESQSKDRIVDLDERQTEEIKIILKKISTPRISTSHINENQVGLESGTTDGSPDLIYDSEPPPLGEGNALPLRSLGVSPLNKTTKAFEDSPFEKGPLIQCSQSKVKININLSTKTLPIPGVPNKNELDRNSVSFESDCSALKTDCSIEPQIYKDIDERILPNDGSILPPMASESLLLQPVDFKLVPPPVATNQSLETLIPSVPRHVAPHPLQTSSNSSIGSVVINLNVPPPPFINVPPLTRFSSSQNLSLSSTASQSQQTAPRFLSRPLPSSPPRHQFTSVDTCSPSGSHSRTSPGSHSELFHSMASSHNEVNVLERVMTDKDKDGRSYLSRQDKGRGVYGQDRRRTHDKGGKRHRSRSNSRGRSRSRSRSRDSKRRRRHSRSRTPVRRFSRRNRSRSPTL